MMRYTILVWRSCYEFVDLYLGRAILQVHLLQKVCQAACITQAAGVECFYLFDLILRMPVKP